MHGIKCGQRYPQACTVLAGLIRYSARTGYRWQHELIGAAKQRRLDTLSGGEATQIVVAADGNKQRGDVFLVEPSDTLTPIQIIEAIHPAVEIHSFDMTAMQNEPASENILA